MAYNKMPRTAGNRCISQVLHRGVAQIPQAALCLAYMRTRASGPWPPNEEPGVVRPAWGEAWLVRAEVEVFLGELRRGPREVGDGPETSREARPGQGRQGVELLR